MISMLKRPSAWVPVALSLTVLAIMLTFISISGPPVRQPDEGTGAHLFQIWLASEVLLVSFFAVKWLPQAPGPAAMVLAVQIAAALAACAPVYYFHL